MFRAVGIRSVRDPGTLIVFGIGPGPASPAPDSYALGKHLLQIQFCFLDSREVRDTMTGIP